MRLMKYIDLLRDEEIRWECIKAVVHIGIFALSLYFPLLKGFVLLIIVLGSAFLLVAGFESASDWLLRCVVPPRH